MARIVTRENWNDDAAVLSPEDKLKLKSAIKFYCLQEGSTVKDLAEKLEIKRQQLQEFFIKSDSAIHCAILPGNARVKQISTEFLEAGFDVKAILSPTVPTGQERLRICLHSYNSQNEIKTLLALLAKSLE